MFVQLLSASLKNMMLSGRKKNQKPLIAVFDLFGCEKFWRDFIE